MSTRTHGGILVAASCILLLGSSWTVRAQDRYPFIPTLVEQLVVEAGASYEADGPKLPPVATGPMTEVMTGDEVEREPAVELRGGRLQLVDLGGRAMMSDSFTTPHLDKVESRLGGEPTWFGLQNGVQVLTILVSDLPEFAGVPIAEVAIGFALPGMETLEASEFVFDPLLRLAFNISLAAVGGQPIDASLMVSGRQWAPTATVIPVLIAYTARGVLVTVILPATAEHVQVAISESLDGTIESLTSAVAEFVSPSDVVVLGETPASDIDLVLEGMQRQVIAQEEFRASGGDDEGAEEVAADDAVEHGADGGAVVDSPGPVEPVSGAAAAEVGDISGGDVEQASSDAGLENGASIRSDDGADADQPTANAATDDERQGIAEEDVDGISLILVLALLGVLTGLVAFVIFLVMYLRKSERVIVRLAAEEGAPRSSAGYVAASNGAVRRASGDSSGEMVSDGEWCGTLYHPTRPPLAMGDDGYSDVVAELGLAAPVEAHVATMASATDDVALN